MRTPPLAYVAGAYSAPTPEEVQANVDRAIDAGNRLMDAGLRVRVPHLSHYQHARKPRDYRTWMEIDFADLRECDMLLRLPGPSSGADEEVALAESLGIPVFRSEERLLLAVKWARGESVADPGPCPKCGHAASEHGAFSCWRGCGCGMHTDVLVAGAIVRSGAWRETTAEDVAPREPNP